MLLHESAVLNRLSGTRSEYVGMCRFVNNHKVTLISLMDGNKLVCKANVTKEDSVLALHDTSDLNFMNHSGKLKVSDGDLGPTSKKDSQGVGFLIHPSLVVDRATGFPKGYSHIKIWNRKFGQADKLERSYANMAIEEKESYKWLEGVTSSNWLSESSKHVTHVMDRESDIYEVFLLPRAKNEDLIVRVSQDRLLIEESIESEEPDGEIKLKDYLSQQPKQCSFQLKIKGNKNRKKRTAKLSLKYGKVRIKRPARKIKGMAPYVEVNVVVVEEYETSVPKGDQPIRWILYTTHDVENIVDAFQIVEWYRKRWIIEELFSTLKTRGLCIEDSQLETGIGLKKLTIIALQAALHILQLVKERDHKNGEKASLIFSSQALIFLKALVKTLEGKTEKQKNPYPEDSLAWAAWGIGRLGGWKGYKSESPPGPRTMKRGLTRFWASFEGWSMAFNFDSS